ncbi:class I SAM-dependent methyltransferase [Catellatospora chokoriensis]|uniref:Methyltransferase domain-containing protein n=1 Tax=Catellatospora chokoriensis TaxID=310353 RepID=A0A8J3NVG0_9ACTN|nr:methyltransferase domain-containing protein [Catellatospora chokoriensis]GIF93942.1 hypothetical protein Cch02nite_73860 [Catellatospora chokoriensis]
MASGLEGLSATAAVWDAEYAAGRYEGEPPVGLVDDIVAAARVDGAGSGLYVGCGSGRNVLPMIAAGLDLTCIDISGAAIDRLRRKLPGKAAQFHVATVADLPAGQWPLVIGIQVFQHGDRETAHDNLRAARDKVAPGGLFALRVNAVGTDVWPAHDVVRRHADGGCTVRYLAGPKSGELIHFYSRDEVLARFAGWGEVLALRIARMARKPPEPGEWWQWEGIWRAPASLG